MGEENKKLGLNNHARSLGSIANAEHHDASGVGKETSGIPATPENFFNDAIEHAVKDFALLRVANDTGSTIYLWIGEAGTNPTVDATNGIAILNGQSDMIFFGASGTNKGLAYKLSAAAQIVVFKQK